MCLAIIKKANLAFPSNRILSEAWQFNRDGAGIAIVRDDEVEIIKGIMTLHELESLFTDDLIKEEVIIHLRYGTSGNIDRGMTHPFPVSNSIHDLKSLRIKTSKAVIHNGVMFNPSMNSNFSDTAIFTRLLAINPKMTHEEIYSIIGDDRLAIARPGHIEFFGQWHELDDGLLYSNLHYFRTNEEYRNEQSFYSRSAQYTLNDYELIKEAFEWNEDLQFCPHCNSNDVELIGLKTLTVECQECGTIYNETQFLEGELNNETYKGIA